MSSLLMQTVLSSLINAITRNEIMRAVKGQQVRCLPLSALPLMWKVMGKGVTRAGTRYNSMDHMDDIF